DVGVARARSGDYQCGEARAKLNDLPRPNVANDRVQGLGIYSLVETVIEVEPINVGGRPARGAVFGDVRSQVLLQEPESRCDVELHFAEPALFAPDIRRE